MSKFSPERRRFTLAAAAAASTAMIHPIDVLAGISQSGTTAEQQSKAETPATSLQQKAQAAMDKLSPSARAEVEMKFASVIRKYGARLAEDQKMDIRRSLAETQDGVEKMRAFALDNGDQPATVFQLQLEGKK
jgi:acyl-CoA reductase-like NAD-dependent aldehyde dehydrogenase